MEPQVRCRPEGESPQRLGVKRYAAVHGYLKTGFVCCCRRTGHEDARSSQGYCPRSGFVGTPPPTVAGAVHAAHVPSVGRSCSWTPDVSWREIDVCTDCMPAVCAPIIKIEITPSQKTTVTQPRRPGCRSTLAGTEPEPPTTIQHVSKRSQERPCTSGVA